MQTQEILTFEPKTPEESDALKAFANALKITFKISKKPYNPDFVLKILESEKQIKEGKTTRVKRENLKKYLGL